MAGIFGWKEYTRKNGPLKDLKLAIEAAIPPFIQEFDANEMLTLQAGQTFTFKGMFTGFQRDDTGLLGF